MAQNKRDIADILHDYISEKSEQIEESLQIGENLITNDFFEVLLPQNLFLFIFKHMRHMICP